MSWTMLLAGGVAAVAHAQALTLDPPVPGKAGRDIKITVTGATPGEAVRLAISATPGATEVPACPGVFIDMLDPVVVGPAVADEGGVAQFLAHAPVVVEGQTRAIQAVQVATCDTSSALWWAFPTGTEMSLGLADVRFLGEGAWHRAGASVSSAGDVNGDGLPDLLVGAYGAFGGYYDGGGGAYLLLAPVGGGDFDLANADARLMGEQFGDATGISVSGAGDVNGDGFDDLLLGCGPFGPSGVGAYLVLGPVSGDFDLANAGARLLAGPRNRFAGESVSRAGDLNGDGFDDLLVGASRGCMGAGGDWCEGVANVVYGPVSGNVDLDDAGARLGGEAWPDSLGASVSRAGDVDGDGLPDFLVGAPGAIQGSFNGAAYLVLDPVTGNLPILVAADARLKGEPGSLQAGTSVAGAGDVNSDGYADVLVGAPAGPERGRAYLVHGPINGMHNDLAAADARFLGAGPLDRTGQSVAKAGDVNDDGFGDVLIGAFQNDAGGTDAGVAYLVVGRMRGTIDLAAADARLIGEGAYDEASLSLSGVGDIDGDGLDDLLIGARYNDAAGTDAGAAYLVFASSL